MRAAATRAGGVVESFITVVNVHGTGLLYSTFLGGSGDTANDGAFAIARDGAGAVYVAGETNSPTYPVTPGAFAKKLNITGAGPFPDGFVAKLEPFPSGPGLVNYGGGTPGCAGRHALRANSTPKIDNALFNVYCDHAPPNSKGLLIIADRPDFAGSDSLGIGVLWHIDFGAASELFTIDIASNDLGGAAACLPIPNDPALVTKKYYLQAAFLWPAGGVCTPSPVNPSTSSAVEVEVQP